MRPLVIVLLSALLLCDGFAREFKDSKGRTIEAELLAHAGDKIVISRGGKEFVVPIIMFSLEDQGYIADWIQKNPGSVRYKFDFYTDLERGRPSTSKGSMIDDRLKVLPYTYEMIVYNKEIAAVQGIEVRYEIYVADFVDAINNTYSRLAVGGEKIEQLQTIAGSFTVDKMEPGGRKEFSRTFNTESYVDRDGGKLDAAATDKVIGVRIRVLKDGKVLAEHVDDEDSRRIEKAIWQDAEPSEGTVLDD